MKSQFLIDWLRITVEGASPQQLIHWGEAVTGDTNHSSARGVFGYDQTRRWNDNPTMVAWDSANRQRPMLDLTGKSLELARLGGFDVLGAVRDDWAQAFKLHCTRIDITLDVWDSGIKPSRLVRRSKVNKSSSFRDSDGGETQYIGANESERKLLAYNKGIESGAGGDWIRLEFRLKGTRAAFTANALLSGSSVEGVWFGHFADMIRGEEAMKRLLKSSEPAVYTKGRTREETNAREWLLKTVAKTVARTQLAEDGFWQEFCERVSFYYTQLGGELE